MNFDPHSQADRERVMDSLDIIEIGQVLGYMAGKEPLLFAEAVAFVTEE